MNQRFRSTIFIYVFIRLFIYLFIRLFIYLFIYTFEEHQNLTLSRLKLLKNVYNRKYHHTIYNHGQNTFWTKYRNRAELDWNRKLWQLPLRNFQLLLQKSLSQLNFDYFFLMIPNLLRNEVFSRSETREGSPKSFGSSYIMFVILAIKNHFPCGEWRLS